MRVINYVIYAENPYHDALYGGLDGRYEPVRDDVDAAIRALRKERRQLFHIHWEEHCIRNCRSLAEAKAAKDYLLKRTRYFVKLGGKVVWTVHNLLPHELEHPEVFLQLRQGLADVAERILVHNVHAIAVLNQQIDVAPHKLLYLPHPSYLGIYEPEAVTEAAAVTAPASRTLLAFGKLRRYKGFDVLLDRLPETLLDRHDLALHVVGHPLPEDPFLDELQTLAEDRPRVSIVPRNVPNAEVPGLFRESAGLVLPYERFLTSGVALLALTVGLPVIAPDTPQMRELLPREGHRLLYSADEDEDFRRAVVELVELDPDARAELVRATLDRAQYLHPERIGRQLGDMYDRLLAA